jgi:hypothetical protein
MFSRALTVETRIRGRTVAVFFETPYRWAVYQDGINVTRDFGNPTWSAWIAEVNSGRISITKAPRRVA